jgi:hypothetical protein
MTYFESVIDTIIEMNVKDSLRPEKMTAQMILAVHPAKTATMTEPQVVSRMFATG